jgi:hypothetical protein
MAREKRGGRQAGTPNKPTEMRTRIKSFLDENFKEVEKEFKSLDALQKITFYEKLIKYAIPQLKAVEFVDEKKESFDYSTMEKADLISITNILKKYQLNEY